MDPNAHDQACAAVSHLPHLLAFAYLLGLMDQADHLEWMDRAGPGFRDFSRIAASDPVIWRDILLANAEHVLTQSQHFSAALDTLSQAIRSGDAQALQSLIQRASEQRFQRLGHVELGGEELLRAPAHKLERVRGGSR